MHPHNFRNNFYRFRRVRSAMDDDSILSNLRDKLIEIFIKMINNVCAYCMCTLAPSRQSGKDFNAVVRAFKRRWVLLSNAICRDSFAMDLRMRDLN